jgi:hypothetical protein
MTTFKEIRGTTIEVVSSDPSNPEEGQIWYNSSSGTLKGYALANVNAWSSGGNLNTARGAAAGSGTQTAAICVTGEVTGPPSESNATELYNGTSWTTSPAVTNTGRRYGRYSGTQTAGVVYGGYNGSVATGATEIWNGSVWTTSPATMGTGRQSMAPASNGTQTATITFGGNTPSPLTTYANTESFNGTAWSPAPSLNTARMNLGGVGTQTAALAFGGTPSAPNQVPVTGATESYNGSAWTNVNSMNTARGSNGGFGTQTLAITMGGYLPPVYTRTAIAESWNGTSWTSIPSLSSARNEVAGAGTQTAGLAFSGYAPSPGYLNFTEEWTGQALQTKTITVS